jgi:hypothetical protein
MLERLSTVSSAEAIIFHWKYGLYEKLYRTPSRRGRSFRKTKVTTKVVSKHAAGVLNWSRSSPQDV